MVCVPLMLGVWIRVRVPNFLAADLSFEATILLGLLLGPAAAMAGRGGAGAAGAAASRVLALPVNLLVAVIFGAVGRFLRTEDDLVVFAADRSEHVSLGAAER